MEELNNEIACEALKKGTHNIKFMDSLIKNPAATYQQLMEKSQKYTRLYKKVQMRKDKERHGYEGDNINYPVSRRRDDQHKYKNYTSLDNSRTCILMCIRKNMKEVRWPPKLNPERAKR